MIHVIIADDEHSICRLIEALINWEELGMKVVGIAHNGLEASEMIRLCQPQILITDIRMPGKSGLELIEDAKKIRPDLEIIIVSGYAHFEYAKNAIRFGVGEYLLKPISKTELETTLRKLAEKIRERRRDQEKTQDLIQKNKKDVSRLQRTLIQHLIEQKEEVLTYDILKNEYQVNVCPGLFQVVWVKLDHYHQDFNKTGIQVIMEKVLRLLETSVGSKCMAFFSGFSRSSCVGIMNYQPEKQEELRRRVKDCLNQLTAHREVFGNVLFSVALALPVSAPENIPDSVKETKYMIEERLLKGSGRILEKVPFGSGLREKNLSEKYLREIRHAIDIYSEEAAEAIVSDMRKTALCEKNICGYEIAELVEACGTLFFSQIEINTVTEVKREFRDICEQCALEEELFEELIQVQKLCIQRKRKERESEDERPIRIAKQFIRKHFAEQITLEEVSAVAGLSPTYFSVQFKKSEGEGFAKYLINLRMEQAKLLLRETNLSVSDICRRVGYHDLKHFTSTFEKNAGIKPSVFRKLYG